MGMLAGLHPGNRKKYHMVTILLKTTPGILLIPMGVTYISLLYEVLLLTGFKKTI